MQVCAYIGILLCLSVNTHTRSVKETEGEIVVEGRIPLHTSFVEAEENPVVSADPCTPNPCKNGGSCINFFKMCQCPAGFYGTYCEQCGCQKGTCKENNKGILVCTCPEEWGLYGTEACKECRCGKGANCSFSIGSFFRVTKACLCKAGYKDVGGVCKDLCDPNPCKNGGTCNASNGKVTCKCNDQYTGDNCATDLCDPNPCKNGGTCSVSTGKVTCKCSDPYTGDNCATDLCDPNPCQNGGTCSVSNGKVTCKCNHPYTGENCATEQSKCKNGFWKENDKGIVVCTCPSEWGKLSPTECKPCDCGKDSNCTFDVGGLKGTKTCLCEVGYEDINGFCNAALCAVNPCKNGGTCRMEGDMAQCYCISPFTGKLCEKDPCFSNPCVNGGQCKVNGTSFQCKCGLLYSGKFCEEDFVMYVITLAAVSGLSVIIIALLYCLLYQRYPAGKTN